MSQCCARDQFGDDRGHVWPKLTAYSRMHLHKSGLNSMRDLPNNTKCRKSASTCDSHSGLPTVGIWYGLETAKTG